MHTHVGSPYVCNFGMITPARPNETQLQACIHTALSSTLRPRLPVHFTRESYSQRVRDIFASHGIM